MLGMSTQPLAQAYDLVMLDLDGVVYIGGAAIPGVSEHLRAARADGSRLAFITNNASRPPRRVAEHLTELDIPAEAEDVVTSAQAAARLLAERWGPGARIARVGGPGLDESLLALELVPVDVTEPEAVAILTGYGPDVRWREITHAAVRIRDGLPWVATNTDATFPTDYGLAPGHGAQVELLSRFADVVPTVAGKPSRPLLDETVRRVGGNRPLMVGDRLDTDILGARNAGCDSLLVLTGVTGLSELVAAPAEQRPTYVAPDLAALLEPVVAPTRAEHTWTLDGWRARVEDGLLRVTGEGRASAWWQVVAVAAWDHLDAAGKPVEVRDLVVPAR